MAQSGLGLSQYAFRRTSRRGMNSTDPTSSTESCVTVSSTNTQELVMVVASTVKAEKRKWQPPSLPRPLKKGRFGGETVKDILLKSLDDHLCPGLTLVFVGINPGLNSAHRGHHYAGSNNHFWPLLYESGLVPEPLTYKDDSRCPAYGIGFTNIVHRTTKSSSDLSRKEIEEGAKVLAAKLVEYGPKIVCFNGKGIYEVFSGQKACELGLQRDLFPGTTASVYVMPSTSGRTSSHPTRASKLPFFRDLKTLVNKASAGLPLVLP
eukprot:comp18279_c0_seq1/m.19297 comp18279_c0_seq1/g.19297  ORF comp18279_c0_seq1/g.19297 comp18279_c0_seq1/m.19297 type:complete len:264 (-) comp18279_c0_seq1:17-808(-)